MTNSQRSRAMLMFYSCHFLKPGQYPLTYTKSFIHHTRAPDLKV